MGSGIGSRSIGELVGLADGDTVGLPEGLTLGDDYIAHRLEIRRRG